jgi:hypothetical protein
MSARPAQTRSKAAAAEEEAAAHGGKNPRIIMNPVSGRKRRTYERTAYFFGTNETVYLFQFIPADSRFLGGERISGASHVPDGR